MRGWGLVALVTVGALVLTGSQADSAGSRAAMIESASAGSPRAASTGSAPTGSDAAGSVDEAESELLAFDIAADSVVDQPDDGMVEPAAFAISPTEESTRVRLDEVVQVGTDGGLLTAVTVTDSEGRQLAGEFDKSKSTWTAPPKLDPNRTYRVRVEAINAEGARSVREQEFSTLKPKRVLKAEILPEGGETVGVGMPLVVTFNHSIAKKADKAEMERRLAVVTSKPVTGSWHWFTDTEVHFRPKSYWPANTDVELRADTKSVEFGDGTWATNGDVRRFRIGRSVVTKIDLFSYHANVYVDGELARSIPVTGGKPGWRTRQGTKVILDKEMYKRFTNEMINAPESYSLMSKYALRVTWSGEFLHTASWSVGSQGWANVSHGCVGMNLSNSAWLYGLASVGDPVEVKSSGSQMATYGNGYGDWNMSWKEWRAGSAIESP